MSTLGRLFSNTSRAARIVFWGGFGLMVASLMFAGVVWIRQATPEDFSVPTLGREPFRLADTRGKVVVLNFWASWCEPCAAEMPEIEAFYQAHKGEDIVVIGINVGEAPETALAFAHRAGVTFPIGLDEDGSVATSFGMRGLPITVVIDRMGFVRWNYLGQIDRAKLEQHIP